MMEQLIQDEVHVQALFDLVLHLTNLGDALAAAAYVAGLRDGMAETGYEVSVPWLKGL